MTPPVDVYVSTSWATKPLSDPPFGNVCLVGWFEGWLVGWLVVWLVGWLVGWVVGCLRSMRCCPCLRFSPGDVNLLRFKPKTYTPNHSSPKPIGLVDLVCYQPEKMTTCAAKPQTVCTCVCVCARVCMCFLLLVRSRPRVAVESHRRPSEVRRDSSPVHTHGTARPKDDYVCTTGSEGKLVEEARYLYCRVCKLSL